MIPPDRYVCPPSDREIAPRIDAPADTPADGPFAPRAPHSPDRRASARRYAHGDRRSMGWLEGPIHTHLCCPVGHHIRDGMLVVGEQFMRCQHRGTAGTTPCGLLVWVAIVDPARPDRAFVAEVDYHDVTAIKQHRSLAETLLYLDAPMWPRIAATPRRG